MDRGSLFAEKHDSILRNLGTSTGKPLSHWFALIAKSGRKRKGFLAIQAHLRDDLGVGHDEATSIAYAWVHPHLIPDDLHGEVPAARTADLVPEGLEELPESEELRAAVEVPEPRAAKAKPGAKAKNRAKAKARTKAARSKAARKPKASPARMAKKAAAPARKPKKAARLPRRGAKKKSRR